MIAEADYQKVLRALRATLQDALDFIGTDGVIGPGFKYKQTQVCTRLRQALGVVEKQTLDNHARNE